MHRSLLDRFIVEVLLAFTSLRGLPLTQVSLVEQGVRKSSLETGTRTALRQKHLAAFSCDRL